MILISRVPALKNTTMHQRLLLCLTNASPLRMSGCNVILSSPGNMSKKARTPALRRTSLLTQSHTSSSLLGSPREVKVENVEQEEQMAGCFPSYCAMCEKEILYASNPLYCSEACRRKDSVKPLSAANIMYDSVHATTPVSPTRPILKPRTPTGVQPGTSLISTRSPADIHAFKSDLDPTEWKPKAIRCSRPAASRYHSEAFRYLSSFHRAVNKGNDYGDTPYDFELGVPDMTAIAATVPNTPSLGNTPTTTASSWSMGTSLGYTSSCYDFKTRPLAPRHNRWYSASVVAGSGIDLVTPHIPPSTKYAKQHVVGSPRAQGGLGAIFGADAE